MLGVGFVYDSQGNLDEFTEVVPSYISVDSVISSKLIVMFVC